MGVAHEPAVPLHGFRLPVPRGVVPRPSERVHKDAKTVYDLLRALVEMTAWHTEDEERDYYEAVNAAERLGVFGNMATQLDNGRDGRT